MLQLIGSVITSLQYHSIQGVMLGIYAMLKSKAISLHILSRRLRRVLVQTLRIEGESRQPNRKGSAPA